ncbi:MAG: response regulator [Proteobacteria bacterium]|nr:response regulator [Pseudomonadota bacterium]
MRDNDLQAEKDTERVSSSSFPRVLLVDDEPMMWRMMNRIVGPKYVLETASEALQAVELLNKHKFHIVVTNYRLPGHDGIWLLKMVKESNPDAQRILLTEHAAEAIDENIKSGLIHRSISKPINHDDFANMFTGEDEE